MVTCREAHRRSHRATERKGADACDAMKAVAKQRNTNRHRDVGNRNMKVRQLKAEMVAAAEASPTIGTCVDVCIRCTRSIHSERYLSFVARRVVGYYYCTVFTYM